MYSPKNQVVIFPALPAIIWRKKYFIIGLTGTIAAGKSLATLAFQEEGARILSADTIAHEVLNETNIQNKIINAFGKDILEQIPEKTLAKQNPRISREKLGRLVFENEHLRLKLNSIVHPIIFERVEKCCTNLNAGEIMVYDAPLLFESGSEKYSRMMDLTICIDAPKEIRFDRAKNRSGWSNKEFENRERSQWTAQEKAKMAQLYIENKKDKQELTSAVKQIMKAVHSAMPQEI